MQGHGGDHFTASGYKLDCGLYGIFQWNCALGCCNDDGGNHKGCFRLKAHGPPNDKEESPTPVGDTLVNCSDQSAYVKKGGLLTSTSCDGCQ